MTSRKTVVDKDSVEAQNEKYADDAAYAVEDDPELRATVELESQAKVDTNHPDARPEGMTLEGQETHLARKMEKERTRQRLDRRQQSSRERRTRKVARSGSHERRQQFEERAASVAPSQGPSDPRELCSQAELARINEQAARLVEEVDGWSRAAIARRLAARVVDGADISRAVLDVVEGCQREPGTAVPIAAVPEVDRATVSIEGTVSQLWDADSEAISQVGLLEDESGRIKWTSWVKSRMPIVQEGDRVVFRNVAKNWYQGRCSVALTGQSHIHFPDRDRWTDQ
ncbi:DNA-binding protein [Halorientalis marina]|uniref:DNA-binding protein n=1 Tax=Halorientalis marina TaxID=2931976 RepID=UPI001FF56F3A|nr:DNA-binding protein [Halorientalis marina]